MGAESKADVAEGRTGVDPFGVVGKTGNGWGDSNQAAIAVGTSDGSVRRQIIGVAAGTKDNDAVNVAQLKAVGLKTEGNSGTGSVGLASQKLSVIGGNNNITTAADGQEIKVNLSNTLNLGADGSVTFGTGTNPTKLNNSGLTVNGGPSVTTGGIYAGGKKITGVAAGTDNTDAVNLQQLKAAVADVDFDPVLNTSGSVGTGSVNLKSGKLNVIGANGNITTTASGEDIRIGLSNNVDVTTLHATTVSATDVNATTVNTNFLHAGPAVDIGPTGISMGGTKITNLKAGTEATDAVNYGQLTAVQNQLDNVHFNVANSSSGTGTSRGTAGTVKSGDTVTFVAGNNMILEQDGNKLTYSAVDNTASHTFSLSDQDGNNKATAHVDEAIQVVGANGIATKVVDNKLQIAISNPTNGLTFNGDDGKATVALDNQVTVKGGAATSSLTDGNIGVEAAQSGKNGVLTVKLAKDINLGSDGSVTTGATKVNNTGLVITNGPSVTTGGINTAGKKITNVADGDVTAVSTDAVNGRQLYNTTLQTKGTTGTGSVRLADQTLSVTGGNNNITTTASEQGILVHLNNKLDLGAEGSVTAGNTVVNTNGVSTGSSSLTGSGLVITGGPSVTTGGINVGGKKVTGMAAGNINATSTDGVNGAQLVPILNEDGTAKGLKFMGNANITTVEKKPGDTLGILGTGSGASDQYSAENIQTSVTRNGDILVSMSKNPVFDNIQVGGNDKAGNIALAGPNGTNGVDGGTLVNIGVKNGDKGLNGEPLTRVVYQDGAGEHQMATMQDGLKFGGDTGDVINRPLGTQLNVKGGAPVGNLTDNNIGVVSDGSDTLNVKLNKDIVLGTTGSVTFGTTKVDNTGLYINGNKGPRFTETGADMKDHKITNLADGTIAEGSKDAINGGQLYDAIHDHDNDDFTLTFAGNSGTVRKNLGDTVTIRGDGTGSDTQYSAENIRTRVNDDGEVVVAMKKDLHVDSITAGKDGKDGVTLSGENGVGTIGLTGPAGTNGKDGATVDISVQNGKNGLNGENLTRLVYEDGNGVHQVATLQDGLKFGGDTGDVINRQLNQQLDIKGGATKGLTDNNIGVVSDGENTLNVKLAKDLTGLNSVTTNTLTVPGANGDVVISNSGIDAGGNKITNVATGTNDTDAVNYGQIRGIIEDGGLTFKGNSGSYKAKLNDTVTVRGEGTKEDSQYSAESIRTRVDDNGNIVVMLDKDLKANSLVVGEPGKDGKDGEPGKIGIAGPAGTNGLDGKDGKDATWIDIGVAPGYDVPQDGIKGENGVDGKDGITRIVYQDAAGEHQVATMEDGMVYGGDTGRAIALKLNNQLDVKGGITDESKLSDNNIGVVSDGTGTLNVKLAKNLAGLDSVAADTMTTNTLTVPGEDGAGSVVIGKDGIDAGGKKITGVANGTNDTDAVNYSQLQEISGKIDNGNLTFAGNTGSVVKKLGETLTVKGEGAETDSEGKAIEYSGENVRTAVDKDGNVLIQLNKNLTANSMVVGEKGEPGQDGKPGMIGLIGPAGTNGIDGKDGKDATQVNIGVAPGYDVPQDGIKGENGVDGKDGITRIVYQDGAGEHQVATMEDGMIYGGDIGDTIALKLNNQLDVKGGITDATKLSDNNIGVVSDGKGALNVKLAKDLQGLSSVTTDTLKVPGATADDPGVVINKDGINAGGKKITNVANGTDDSDAVNYGQLKGVQETVNNHTTNINNITEKVNAGWELQANGSHVKNVTPNTDEKKGNNVVNFVAGDNVTIVPNTDSTTNASSITISSKNYYTENAKLSGTEVIFTRNDGQSYSVDLKNIAGDGSGGGGGTSSGQDLRLLGAGDNLTDPYFVGKDTDHTLTLTVGDPNDKDSFRSVQVKGLATVDDLAEVIDPSTGKAKGLFFAGNQGEVKKVPGDTVTIKGEGLTTGSDGKAIEYSAENVRTKVDDDGNVVVMLNKNLKADGLVVGEKGDQGEPGTPGEIGLIGPKGEDGKNAEAYISTKIGEPGLNGTDGITRIVYQDAEGIEHQVATFDDGMKFGGDSGDVIAKHLNQQLDIKGGAEGALSDNNIGVVSKDGVLNVKLAKDIEGLDSVSTATLTVPTYNGDVVINKDGIDAGGNKVTNVAAGTNDTDAVNYSQLKEVSGKIDSGNLTFAGNEGTPAAKKLGETVTIKGEGLAAGSDGTAIEYSAENVRTKVDADGNVVVMLNKNLKANGLVVGEKGEQGEPGTPGEIGLIGPAGADGKNAEANISTKIGEPGLNGKDGITRIVYQDADGVEHQVATFDDGMKFGGDSGDVIAKHLNQQLDIKGGADASALTDNNIGVISRDGVLNVKLAKDLKDLDSVETATLTVPTNNGDVVINKDGIDAGGNKITNVKAGTMDTDAVNYGQIKDLIDGAGTGYILEGNSGEVQKKLGDTLTIKGEGTKADNEYSAENIKTRVNDAGELVVMLDKDVTANSLVVGKNGADGQPGASGKDGVTIYAKDGERGPEGHIGLTGPAGADGKDATADISVQDGRPGLDGKDGITRIVYVDEDNKPHEVATFDDGMKFAGDSGEPVSKKLNETLDIVGGSTATAFTDKNIAVISDDGKLKIQMAKDLTGLSSVTTDRLVVPTTNNPVTIGQNGIDAGGNRITDVRDGRIAAGSTDAVNGGQLYGVSQTVNNISNVVDAGWQLNVNGTKLKDVTPDSRTVNVVAGKNVKVTGSGSDVTIAADNTYTTKAELTNYNQTLIFTRTDGTTYSVDIVPEVIDLPFTEGKDLRLVKEKNAETGRYTDSYKVADDHTLTLHVTDGTVTDEVKIENLATMDDLSGLIDPDTGETKGLTFEADKGTPAEKKPGDRIAVKGDGNVNTEMDSEGNLRVSLNKEVSADKVVVGPAGADGKDGVTIYAKDGADGKEGHIGLTGPKGADGVNATADISVQDGKPGLNGTDGITRIVYVDEDNQPHEVATFDDGLMFGGDTGTPLAKKLNEQLDIKGGVTDEDKLIDGNIGVVAKDGVLNVKLAKDLTGLNSVTTNTLTVPGDSGDVVINNQGINAGGTTITNVAPGKDDTDAVNFSQIKQLVGSDGQTPLGLTFKDSNENQRSVLKKPGDAIAIKGEGTKLDEKYSAENVKTRIDDNGDLIIMLDKDMTTESVVTNEITIKGEKGADGKDATANITVKDGKDGLNGETVTRIVYEDRNGKEHQVATFDDGLKFVGDDGKEVAKNLNETLAITGGVTEADKMSNDSNIGVVKEGEGLRLKLAKDVKGLNSVEAGGAVLGNQGGEGSGVKDNKGNEVPEGTYLTNLTNTDWNTQDPTFVSGRAATEDQLAKVSKSLTSAEDGGGFGLTAEDGQSVKKDLGATVDVVGDGKNISTKVEDGKVVVAMSDDLELDSAVIGRDGKDGKDGVYIGKDAIQGKDGADGKDGISVRGADGTDGVTIYAKDGADGSEGHIGLTGPKGADGKDASADISVKNGKDGLNGETVTRLVYEDAEGQEHRVATMDDGMKFKGDDGTEVAKKLNETLSITGGADKDNLSDDNIGVVADKDGGLSVKLAKDVKGLNSVEAGGAVLGNQGGDGSGVKDNKGNEVPEGTYLTNLTNTDWNTQDPTFVSGRAATEDQLAKVSKSLTSAEDGGGFGLTAEDGQSVKKDLGATVDVVGDGKNISTKVEDGKVVVAMSDDLELDSAVIGRDGKDGKDGVYIGKDAIQGKDGADGKDGISVRGADGTDGVTIYAKDGKDGADGSEGHIGLTGLKGLDGKDATADIYVREGKAGLNGQDGRDGITRVMYDDEDGTQHQVATFDDGLLFGGDTGDTVARNINQQLDIKGGVTDPDKLSDNNIGVVANGEDALTVKLAKDLKGLDSIETKTLNVTEKLTAGDIETNTLTVKETLTAKEVGADKVTVKDTLQIGTGDSPVTINDNGMDMGGRSINNVQASTDPNAAATVGQLGAVLNESRQNDAYLDNRITNLDNKTRKGLAGAAALAALHPLDFDPDDKLTFAAGLGHYGGQNAAAVGAFYRPDDKTMFSVGASMGNGENMVNVGVSFALDRVNRQTTSKVAMAKEIVELKQQMMQMQQMLNARGLWLDPSLGADFPDTPENHWAYEYVKTLAGNGIIEGYPDGTFDGERRMTRYEFAAMLYRAMMNGAQLDPRAAKEFAPELGRIRVDRISGTDSQRHKVERVRVNNEDVAKRDIYGTEVDQSQVEKEKAALAAEKQAREQAEKAAKAKEAQLKEAQKVREQQAREAEKARIEQAKAQEKQAREAEKARIEQAKAQEKQVREAEKARLKEAKAQEKQAREAKKAQKAKKPADMLSKPSLFR